MRSILFTILLLVAGSTFAQDPMITLYVTTKDDDSGKKLSGATVEVKSEGKVIMTKTSASNGKVPPIDLPLGKKYTITIKKQGYVPKVATVGAYYDYPEDLPPSVPFQFETSLFKEVEGVDFNWMKTTPLIKFEMDQYGQQTWDNAYTKKMLEKIEKLKEELERKKEEEAEKRAQFEEFVEDGDKAFDKEEYQEAVDNYDKALAIFDEEDVKQKRDKAQKALEEKQAAEQAQKEYEAKMEAGSQAFDVENYKEALKQYQEASSIKPEEKDPKDRIAEIQEILSELEAQQEKFDKFVSDGDAAMGSEDYDAAISNYESALDIKKDAGVEAKLEDAKKKKIEKEEAEQAAKEKEEKYNNLIADADKAYDSETYEEAKQKYEEALNLKPNESHPAARISEIDEILKKRKETEQAYDNFITAGDDAFANENWDNAIKNYQDALGIKPNESYPSEQIEKAKEKKAQAEAEAEKEEAYNNLMVEAKSLKDAEKYKDAIAKYEEAQGVKPDATEPAEKIKEIEQILENLEAQKEKQAEYEALMKEGADAQAKEELESALEKYQKALELKAGDSAAKQKIDEVKKLIAEKEAAKEKEAKYEAFMQEGNDAQSGKEYESALDKFKKALAIKPNDEKAQQKIEEVQKLIAEQEASQEKEEQYNTYMQEGADAQSNDNLETALEKYQKALGVKPGDSAAQSKIDEVQKLIEEKEAAETKEKAFNELVAKAEKAFNEKDYNNAKKNYQQALDIKDDQGVRDKIAEIEQIIKESQNEAEQQEKYEAAIKLADEAYNKEEWETSLDKYQEAYAIKEETYAKDRIEEVKAKIQELSEQKEKEEQFNELVAQAEELEGQEKYEGAIDKYKAALEIKSDTKIQEKISALEEKLKELKEQEATNQAYQKKIEEADAAFDNASWNESKKLYQEALDIMPNEQYPKNRLEEIERKMKEESKNEVEEQYQKILQKADRLKGEENFEDAISYYKRAQNIKADDPYPQKMIDEIKATIAEREKEKELNEKYNALISSADDSFSNKKYQDALNDYKEALNLKPNESYPQDKINEINNLLNNKEEQEEINQRYETAIAKADEFFKQESWKEAKSAYEKALTIKSSEQYPKDQIDLCNQKMQDESVDEEEKQYQKILSVAQKKFDQKDYQKALELYERAKSIRPSDPIPQQRIDEINQLLKEMENDREKRERYRALIQEADTYFERKEWKDALEKYMDALELFGDEQYPNDQVAKCREFMKKKDEGSEAYNKLISKADEYFNAAKYDKAKNLYQRAVKLSPDDQYPKDKLKEIELILNPPKNDNKIVLNDYGKETNDDPIDLDAELQKAKEEAEYKDVEKIYKTREDANEALSKWSERGNEHTIRSKEEVEEIKDELNEVKYSGEEDRIEATEKIEEWREGIAQKESERATFHENDIHFQKNKVEAMKSDIYENNYENEVAREQFLMDVEKIKMETVEKTRRDSKNQTEKIFDDKAEIEEMVESHVTSDPNKDEERKKAVDNIENMRVEIINREHENAWDQNDEIMLAKDQLNTLEDQIHERSYNAEEERMKHVEKVEKLEESYVEAERERAVNQENEIMRTKEKTEEIVDKIHEQSYDAEQQRLKHVEKVEKLEESYTEAQGERATNQEVEIMAAKERNEKMTQEILDNNYSSEEERIKTEILVTETKDHLSDVESKRSTDQTDAVMKNKESLNKMEDDIQEHKKEMNEDRVHYEDVLEEDKEEIIKYNKELVEKNEDNSYETKEQTEEIIDSQADFLDETVKKTNEQRDKFEEKVEEHIDHMGDLEKDNEEAREKNMDYIEELKTMDPKNITPELENELGEEYPEGVTEETYKIMDDNGLLKTYVVRRIVVHNGVGKVYEKTKTRYGQVSYTKNGSPITEYQWSDETGPSSNK